MSGADLNADGLVEPISILALWVLFGVALSRMCSRGPLEPVRAASARRDWVEAGRLAERALRSGHAPGGTDAWLHFVAGRGLFASRQLDDAIARFDEALNLAAQPSPIETGGYAVDYDGGFAWTCRDYLGYAYLDRGHLIHADTALTGALASHGRGTDRDLIYATCHLSVVKRARGHLEDARGLAELALSYSIDLQDHVSIAQSLATVADVDAMQGNLHDAVTGWTDAIAHYRSANPGGADIAVLTDECVSVLSLAAALAELGRHEEAAALRAEARETVTSIVTARSLDSTSRCSRDVLSAQLAYFSSAIHRAAGDTHAARGDAAAAKAQFAGFQMRLMEAYSDRELGRALAVEGATETARAALMRSAEGFGLCGADLEERIALEELAGLTR